MVMNIVLLDDDPIAIEDCRKILTEYAAENDMDLSVTAYQKEDQLLDQAEDIQPDVAILDIRMGEESHDGIQTGTLINERWPACCVIYLTDYITYASDVYRTKHSYFVLKDQLSDRVGELFGLVQKYKEELLQKQTVSKGIFTSGRKKVSFYPGEILYFERSLRTTKMVTSSGDYTLQEKIGELEEQVRDMFPGSTFCRCHNSYLINIEAVTTMHSSSFTMQDGAAIPISRKYMQQAREAFMTGKSTC